MTKSNLEEKDIMQEPEMIYGVKSDNIQLRAIFFKEANEILDDNRLLIMAMEYIREIKHMDEKGALKPYTVQELNAIIAESEADDEANRTYSCEEVHIYMEKKHPWLCR